MTARGHRGGGSGAAPRRSLRRSLAWLIGRPRPGAAREFDLGMGLRVSIAVHLAAVLVVALWPDWSRPVRWESAPLLVSLVTLPEEARPAAPAPVTVPEPQPERPVEKPRQARTEEPDAPREAVRKKPPERESPPAVTPPAEAKPQPAPEASQPPGPEGPVRMNVQVDEQAFVYDYYLQALVAKISQAWRPPAGLAAGEGASATLRFRITTQGRVSQVEVETSSALPVFDRSAVEAVQRAQPLPPFPPAYRGRWLTVHLRFSLQE